MDFSTIIENYTLPSGGKIYEPNINATGTLRSMTVAEEMKRLSPTDRPYKLLCEIIEDCMQEKPDRPVYEMSAGDYQYLLKKLRIVTYGSDYKIQAMCPKCGKTFETTINLDQEIDQQPITLEDLSIELPKSKIRIKLKLQTPHDLDEIYVRTNSIKEKSPDAIDQSLLYTIISLIDLIDGKPVNPVAAEAFVKKLNMYDANYLMRKAADVTSKSSSDTGYELTCPHCKETFTVPFRPSTEFFEPEIN